MSVATPTAPANVSHLPAHDRLTVTQEVSQHTWSSSVGGLTCEREEFDTTLLTYPLLKPARKFPVL
jgi:hypothetical protein